MFKVIFIVTGGRLENTQKNHPRGGDVHTADRPSPHHTLYPRGFLRLFAGVFRHDKRRGRLFRLPDAARLHRAGHRRRPGHIQAGLRVHRVPLALSRRGMKSLMAQNQAAFEQKTDEITCKGEDEMRLYWKRRLTTSLSEPYTEGTRVAETTVQWRILV